MKLLAEYTIYGCLLSTRTDTLFHENATGGAPGWFQLLGEARLARPLPIQPGQRARHPGGAAARPVEYG